MTIHTITSIDGYLKLKDLQLAKAMNENDIGCIPKDALNQKLTDHATKQGLKLCDTCESWVGDQGHDGNKPCKRCLLNRQKK